ncbi:MAG TPA: cupin domain-containing protein [Rhizomicrobium sp.]|nr:cupin domain-containing protein [Rhizomicrobium sp.]
MVEGPFTFDNVIAPVTRERFLSEFWTKSFLHLRGRKGRFTSLLTWEKLNEVLEWQNPPPLIKLLRGGDLIDQQVYIDHMDKRPEAREINAGRLIAAISQGAALVIDGIQKNAPPVRDLSGQFEDVFQAPNQVNLYAGWGTQNTFHLHWDPQEVFILQLSGRKHWKIYAPTRPFPLKDEAEKTPEPAAPPVWDGVMEDGDFLYLPRGWWHVVHPMNEPSLHLNIGIQTATGADFLGWWLPRLLRHPELRKDLPLGGDLARGRDYFANLLSLMAREDQDLANEFLREWNAFRRAPARIRLPIAPAEQGAPLSMTTRVRLAQRVGLFIEFQPDRRAAKFHAVGGRYDVAPHIVPALERLSGHESKTVGELCQGIENPQIIKDILNALDIMAGAGVILKE